MVPEALVPGPDGTKPICELAPGDAIWSWVDGQLQPHRILHARRSKDQPLLKLRTRNRIVEAPANHRFLRVIRTSPSRHVKGGRRGEQTGATYGVEWTCPDQFRRGDLLVVLDKAPDTGIVEALPDGADVTGDVAWLLGVILGDGTITDRNIRVCVYGETCQQVRRITAETWGAYSAAEHPGYGTILHSVHLAHLLADMGMRRLGPDKRVPEAVWSWPRKLQLAFLDGYRDADGSTPKGDPYRYGERTYASSSRRLLAEIRMLHILADHRVGNLGWIRRTKPITIKGQLVKAAHDLSTLAVYPPGRDQHARMLAERGPDVARFWRNGFGLRRVLGIDPVGVRETWDIEVEDADNFVADGIVVHSSGPVGAVQGKLWSDDLPLAQPRSGCAALTAPAPPDPPPRDRDDRPGNGWHQNRDITVGADYVTAQVPSQLGAVGLGDDDCGIPGHVLIPGPDGTKRIDEITAGDPVWSFVDGWLEAHGRSGVAVDRPANLPCAYPQSHGGRIRQSPVPAGRPPGG